MAADTTYPNIVQRRTDGNLYVPTGKSLVVESSGTLDASAGTLTLAAGQLATATLAANAVTAAKLAQPTIANDFTGTAFRVARASYVFATQGGLVGTIPITGTTGIPNNAVILGGWLDVAVSPTGATATVAVQVEAANDIVNAAAISGAPWSTTGRKSIIPIFTGATTVKTTAARDISIVVGTANLTAGTFDVFLFYVVVA